MQKNFMNKSENDGLKEIIIDNAGKYADYIRDGYTVTIRPTKDNLKATVHKEKVIK